MQRGCILNQNAAYYCTFDKMQNAKRKTQNAVQVRRWNAKRSQNAKRTKRKTQTQKMQNAKRKMHETQNAQNARRSFKMQSQNAKTP